MRPVLCFVGIHHWKHRLNKDVGGPGGRYDVCSRCGRERPSPASDSGFPSFDGRGGRDT
jgi:hypothetical protein